MHGTLEMTYMAVKFNFQPVLLKTLISRMNTLKDMTVLSIIKTDGKYAPVAVTSPRCSLHCSCTETEAHSGFLKGMFFVK